MTKLTVIDLFCGAGGFSEGFRQQGFEIVAGIDSWKPAIDTFNYNFGLSCSPRNILEFSTSTKRIEELPDTEVIIGSPPCVSFSSSNKSGKADKKMGLRLTKIFLRIIAVKKHKPHSVLKAWFMENVTNSKVHLPKKYTFGQLGLKKWSLRHGLDPNSIAISLEENRSLINSADFGVPQARSRVFSGEIIQKKEYVAPERTHQALGENGNLPRHITLGYIRQHLPKPSSERSEVEIVDPLYSGIKIKQSDLIDQFYDTGMYVHDWKESKYLKTNHPYMGSMSFPEKEDRPSRTVTATRIGKSREAIVLSSDDGRIGNGEYRTLTIREAATLMGFPVTFQFLGSVGIKWTLVGNAVCPPVSRAFAKVVREAYGLEEIIQPCVTTGVDLLDSAQNLNVFERANFDTPRQRKKGARFRRHPFKNGNLTVTLSNYDIGRNGKRAGKWRTSIQYGTGEGFPNQSIPDGYYRELEPIIMKFEEGPHFIDRINNGFSDKIANAESLQQMYEAQRSEGKFIEPVELVDTIAELIETIKMRDPIFEQKGKRLLRKRTVPKNQVLALYAINKICTMANGDEK